jgi:hypothetical protein
VLSSPTTAGQVETQAPIQLRYTGQLIDLVAQGGSQDVVHADRSRSSNMLLETTVGRVLFNMHLPDTMPFINGQLKKKGLQNLVAYSSSPRPRAHRPCSTTSRRSASTTPRSPGSRSASTTW